MSGPVRVGGGIAALGVVAGLCLAALGAQAAPAPPREPPSRFDLDCTMQHLVKRRMVKVRTHLRVDLEQRRWCEGACDAVNELTLLADVATLTSPPATEGPVVTHRRITINRRSGRITDQRVATLDQDPVMDDTLEGVCRIGRYTDIDHKLF